MKLLNSLSLSLLLLLLLLLMFFFLYRAKILRLLCIGDEVRASEEEDAAAAASAAAAAAAATIKREHGGMSEAEVEQADAEEAWRAAGGRKGQQMGGPSRAQLDFGW